MSAAFFISKISLAVSLFFVGLTVGTPQQKQEVPLGPPANPKPGSVWVNAKDKAEMVYVPAGEFLMGDADMDNNPRRKAKTTGFYIYKYPVTVQQYQVFCRATKRVMPEKPKWGWFRKHPVVNVSYDDAKAYSDWAGVEMPSEVEWEKAARGTDARRYPWGNDWDPTRAHCSREEHGDALGTAVVGSHPSGASPYGAMDMAGNVANWCQEVDGLDGEHVVRGGNWFHPYKSSCFCSLRKVGAKEGNIVIGFRCVFRPAPPK